MSRHHRQALALSCAAVLVVGVARQPRSQRSALVPLARFVEATQEDERVSSAALREIAAGWKDSYTPMFIDLARMMRPPRRASQDSAPDPDVRDPEELDDRRRGPSDLPGVADRGSPIRRRLLSFLGKQTGQRFGDDLAKWRTWMWALPYAPHPEYATLKGLVYGQIDPRMRAFFPPAVPSTIRLDEIDWGGVKVNGIPPLRLPKIGRAHV